MTAPERGGSASGGAEPAGDGRPGDGRPGDGRPGSRSVVSIARCGDYEPRAIQAAVAEAARLAGGFDAAGKVVLIKPNMLASADPEGAVASAPEMLRAAIRLVRGMGASRVIVGDSPAFQPGDSVGQRLGLKPVALEEGAEWADFGDAVEVAVPGGRVVKRFSIARAVVEADRVVSLCRLKTHSFMYFTGAVKNLFGTVPGLQKSAFHMRFPGRREFGAMLADLGMAVKPAFALMDAVVAMEGPGPMNGSPRRLGYVLAARDPFALDWVASALVGYDPEDIPYLRAAVGSAGLGFDPSAVTVAGVPLVEARTTGFKRIAVVSDEAAAATSPLGRLARNLRVPRPFISRGSCVLCGACVRICPAAALSTSGAAACGRDGGAVAGLGACSRAAVRSVAVDYKKCIRCYCCHEVCPADAITLRRLP